MPQVCLLFILIEFMNSDESESKCILKELTNFFLFFLLFRILSCSVMLGLVCQMSNSET